MDNNLKPVFISVVIPVYNAQETLLLFRFGGKNKKKICVWFFCSVFVSFCEKLWIFRKNLVGQIPNLLNISWFYIENYGIGMEANYHHFPSVIEQILNKEITGKFLWLSSWVNRLESWLDSAALVIKSFRTPMFFSDAWIFSKNSLWVPCANSVWGRICCIIS